MKAWIVASSVDAPLVQRLGADLAEKGVDVGTATSALQPGQSVMATIAAAIEESDVVLIVLSSSATKSSWVSAETALALSATQRGPRKLIIPVLAEEGVVPPVLLEGIQYVDVSNDERYRLNLPKLIEALKTRPVEPNVDAERRAILEYLRSQRHILGLERAAATRIARVRSWSLLTTLLTGLLFTAPALLIVGGTLSSGGVLQSLGVIVAGVMLGVFFAERAKRALGREYLDDLRQTRERLERIEQELRGAEATQ